MDKKYIAVYNISAFSGIGIIDIVYEDETYCICEYFGSQDVKRTKNKVYTETKTDRSYIRKFNKRFYLDEFMKL